jgi:SsrA-binding protein
LFDENAHLCYNAGVAEKIVATNRKAYHEYFIEDTIEAGVVLTGSEIKSVRAGRVNLREGFARIINGEMWMQNVHISPYEHEGRAELDADRDRKLLLHKSEILRLAARIQTKGLTLIPLRVYLKDGRAKVEIGLAKGKRQYDKRAAIAERDADRAMERELAE